MSRFTVNRRSFLRGLAGALVTLPALEACRGPDTGTSRGELPSFLGRRDIEGHHRNLENLRPPYDELTPAAMSLRPVVDMSRDTEGDVLRAGLAGHHGLMA